MLRRAEALPGLQTAAAHGPANHLVALGGGAFAAAVGGCVVLHGPGHAAALPLPPEAAGKPIMCCAASAANGLLLAAGERGAKPALYLWRLEPDGSGPTTPAANLQHPGVVHNFGIAALAFSPSGGCLPAEACLAARLRSQPAPCTCPNRLPTATSHPPAGRLLASHGADKDHTLAVWSTEGPLTAGGKQLGHVRLKVRVLGAPCGMRRWAPTPRLPADIPLPASLSHECTRAHSLLQESYVYEAIEWVGEDRVCCISSKAGFQTKMVGAGGCPL